MCIYIYIFMHILYIYIVCFLENSFYLLMLLEFGSKLNMEWCVADFGASCFGWWFPGNLRSHGAV